jgi:hypothetical protein
MKTYCSPARSPVAGAVNLPPAMAQGPKPSGGNISADISQRVDTGSQMPPRQPRITSTSTDTKSTQHGRAAGS